MAFLAQPSQAEALAERLRHGNLPGPERRSLDFRPLRSPGISTGDTAGLEPLPGPPAAGGSPSASLGALRSLAPSLPPLPSATRAPGSQRGASPPVDSPQNGEASGANVLAAVLDTSNQVWHKLLDGALVLDGAGNALRHLHLVPLAARQGRGDAGGQSV